MHSSSSPPFTLMDVARSASRGRVSISNRDTEAMLGRASPRNPRVRRLRRSSTARILLVAWRFRAIRAFCSVMPQPLSATRIYSVPPSKIVTSILSAPASRAFSTSSFTTEAGFSTTSPAAIWLDVLVSSKRTSASCIMLYHFPSSLPAAVCTKHSWPRWESCSLHPAATALSGGRS